jgi:hypothetical protein
VAHVRGVAVARHVHHARAEAAKGIVAHQQAHRTPFVQVDDGTHDADQLRHARLEQLVARIGLEHVDDGLGVMALRRETEMRHHLLDLAPQQRHLARRTVIRRGRPQTEKAMLAGHAAGAVEFLHADVVEVGAAVHRRQRGSLRQDQRMQCARQLPRRPAQPVRLRPRARRGGAQDAEPGAGVGPEHVAHAPALQAIVAVAEQHELPRLHPLEQGARLGELRAHGSAWRPLQHLDDRAHAPAHRHPVGHRQPHIAQPELQPLFDRRAGRGVGLALDLVVLPRLARRRAARARTDRPQAAVGAAAHREHRMHDELHADRRGLEGDADGVEQERHVVGDDEHAGVRGIEAIDGRVGVEDAHQRRAGPPQRAEAPMQRRDRGPVGRRPALEIVLVDTAVVGRVVAGIGGAGTRRGALDPRDQPPPPQRNGRDLTLEPCGLACQDCSSPLLRRTRGYSTVTLLARLRGWSTSVPRRIAT